MQAPHINVSVLARGVVKRLFTRIYFAGDPANASDPILALVPADRRDTLLAKAGSQGTQRVPLRHPPAGQGRDGILRRLADVWVTQPAVWPRKLRSRIRC